MSKYIECYNPAGELTFTGAGFPLYYLTKLTNGVVTQSTTASIGYARYTYTSSALNVGIFPVLLAEEGVPCGIRSVTWIDQPLHLGGRIYTIDVIKSSGTVNSSGIMNVDAPSLYIFGYGRANPSTSGVETYFSDGFGPSTSNLMDSNICPMKARVNYLNGTGTGTAYFYQDFDTVGINQRYRGITGVNLGGGNEGIGNLPAGYGFITENNYIVLNTGAFTRNFFKSSTFTYYEDGPVSNYNNTVLPPQDMFLIDLARFYAL